MRSAYESGATDHPMKVMRELGYKIIDYEGIPIGDCAIIEVEKLIEPLEKYLTEIKE
ncbi:hypothetical protein [Flavobacterium sp.]|uniref:hypothetical protein n=1 Tax=Flavobacterium sp. TaxID=239 RepID=UPI003752DB5E